MMLEPPLTPPAPSSEQEQGVFVFFSYAHRDKGLRDRLEEHLCNLKYRGLITTWYDREISAGEERAQQIDIYLNKAHIILLLISASFMASEYCYSTEMRQALERHEHHEADVIPILLRPVLYTDAPFAKLQMLPTNGKPIVQWRERDSAFVDIACAIERVAKKYAPSAKTTPWLPIEHAPVDEVAAQSGPLAQPLRPPTMSVTVPLGQPAAQARRRRLSLGVVGLVACILLSIAIAIPSVLSLRSAPAFPVTTATAIANVTATANIDTTATAYANTTATAYATVTPLATPSPTPIATPTATSAPTPTPIATPTATSISYPPPPAPIIILGLLLLVGVIAALIAIGQIRAKIGQRQAQGAFEEARKRGYYEEAIEAYRRALSYNPLDADALRGMGNALYALGYYDQALDAFKRAIDCDSTPAAYAGQGNVFTRLKRYNEAVEAYEKAIELDPTVTFNRDDLVQALRALGRNEEAERVRAKTRQLSYDDQE
jgi:TIR domain/Tetratricopeptide repeat/TPR repeat